MFGPDVGLVALLVAGGGGGSTWLGSCYVLGGNIGALLHEGAPIVPETVVEREHVLKLLRLFDTGVRVLPLIGGQSETWAVAERAGPTPFLSSMKPRFAVKGGWEVE